MKLIKKDWENKLKKKLIIILISTAWVGSIVFMRGQFMQQNNKLKSQREDANNFNGEKDERGRIKKEIMSHSKLKFYNASFLC